jgi:hypothetical protein
MREQIAAMKEIWTKDKPEHHGEFVSFPPMMTWPKPTLVGLTALGLPLKPRPFSRSRQRQLPSSCLTT